MEDLFVPAKKALILKRHGVEIPCVAYWKPITNGEYELRFDIPIIYKLFKFKPFNVINLTNDNVEKYCGKGCVLAPTINQISLWLRSEYKLNCFIPNSEDSGEYFLFCEDLKNRDNDSEPELLQKYSSYEMAYQSIVDKAISVIEKNKCKQSISDLFMSYEHSHLLNKLGFDEPCIANYIDGDNSLIFLNISNESVYSVDDILGGGYPLSLACPTKHQAFNWLFKKLNIEDGHMPLDYYSQYKLFWELAVKIENDL